MFDFLSELMDFLLYPIISLLEKHEIDNVVFSFGFGSIEWFTLTLSELVTIVLSIVLYVWFLRLIFFILKSFVKIVAGAFGVRI